jgi:hypothetical protein
MELRYRFVRVRNAGLTFRDLTRAARLQTMLEGVPLPAARGELVEYAAAQRADAAELRALLELPDRLYDSIDEAAEELVRVQPPRRREIPHEAKEESGAPPGGPAYVEQHPQSGKIRDLGAFSGG